MSNDLKLPSRGYYMKGDQSPDMIKIQQALKDNGCWTTAAFSQNFGPTTDAMVRKFQAEKGLSVDGQVGKNTLIALGLETAAPVKPAPAVESGSMCTTNYKDLPIFNTYEPTLLSFKAAVQYLNSKYDAAIAKAVFVVLGAESSHKDGVNFSSAGHYNYGGVQTDSGKWPGMDHLFVGQFCRKDSVKYRMFAAFENNEGFLDFMCGKLTAKGFADQAGADHWTERYINNWWFKDLKRKDPNKYNEVFPKKKAIYETWSKKYDALNK